MNMHGALRVLFVAGLTLMAAQGRAAEKVIYQLGWIPSGANAIEYVGVADGYFSKAGLDVEIRSGNGSSDALTRIAAGSADIGSLGIESVMAAMAQQKLPVKVIYCLYNKKPDSIDVPGNSSIKTIKDLAGKKIGTSAYSSINVVWPLFLKEHGVASGSVDLMKVDASALAPMMASGQVDGVLNWVTGGPTDASVMKTAGKTMRVLRWSDFGYEGYSQVIVVNEKFLKEKPEVVKQFLMAIAQARDASLADPVKAGEAVAKMVKGVDAKISGEEFAASVPLIDNEITKRDGPGRFDRALLKTTWDWVARSQGLSATAIDPAALVDERYLPARTK